MHVNDVKEGVIGIGSDHAGFHLKESIRCCLDAMECKYVDCGTYQDSPSVDYPDIAAKIVAGLLKKTFSSGILICATGIGMSIAANRCPGIRAALCVNEDMARLSREHNDANILILGSKFISAQAAERILKVWTSSHFAYGRHERRVKKIGMLTVWHFINPAKFLFETHPKG